MVVLYEFEVNPVLGQSAAPVALDKEASLVAVNDGLKQDGPVQACGKRTHRVGNVLAELAGTSITCPPADQKLLSAYFSYLIQSGFLPAPQSVNEH